MLLKTYKILASIIIVIVIMSFVTYNNKPIYANLPIIDSEVISDIRFSSWIGGATNAVDVFVKPADSPNFIGDKDSVNNPVAENSFDRQDFFRWSQQMFLWILSPVPSNGSYGSCSDLVLNSPEFFDFKRDGTNETYVRHRCSSIDKMSFDVKSAQNGIHNLPLFFEEETEKVYDIDKTPISENGYSLVYDGKKNKVEVDKIEVNENKPIFYDRNGKVIENAHLILSSELNPKTTIQQIRILNQIFAIHMAEVLTPIILIPTQNEASVNGSSYALMNRYGSLVYYNIMVNDVYVAFSKMVTDSIISPRSLFPTTLNNEPNPDDDTAPRVGLNTIKNYGASHGIPIIDTGNRVLAMELKTSWVEVTTNLPNSDDYVKVKATVPNYVPDSTLPGTWIRDGVRTTTLALVGMHVVGSVKGHPEMIWSTFEHINNTPNNQIEGIIESQTPNRFIFFDNSLTPMPTTNIPHISGYYNLAGANGFPISSSNTERKQPFGWAGLFPATTPNNPVDILQQSESNIQLKNIYSDVRNRLLPGDVRRNYFQVGAMWNSPFYNAPIGSPLRDDIDNHEAGTVRLSNSTMETYTQASSPNIAETTPTAAGLNCFSCHNRGVDNITGVFDGLPMPLYRQVSHVFGKQIAP